MKRSFRAAIVAAGVVLTGVACPTDEPTSPEGDLAVGTWGGENVALVVEATTAHIHVGCTKGDFPAPLEVDDEGRFSVAGSYILRAYPVEIGPPLPAQFAGVTDGRHLTLTVAVNDTVEHRLVVLGPVTVTLGKEPRMGPCPICDRRMK